MRQVRRVFLCLAALAVFLQGPPTASPASEAIWAKRGVVFRAACYNNRERRTPLQIPSPDGRNSIQVRYKTNPSDAEIRIASLLVSSGSRRLGEIGPVARVDDEILWSPDSRAFFINGNNNANADEHVAVYRVDESHLRNSNVTKAVEKDMARSFPPCRATDLIDNCERLTKHPDEYVGVVALDWIEGSSGVVLMAAIPCTSAMGGIMCQVLGYEVAVPDGTILRRMEPREFAQRWQPSMAWKFRIPAPPSYQDAK